MQALQATAAAEAERKVNSSKARLELEEQMKERQILQQQQQVGVAMRNSCVMRTFTSYCLPLWLHMSVQKLCIYADVACTLGREGLMLFIGTDVSEHTKQQDAPKLLIHCILDQANFFRQLS